MNVLEHSGHRLSYFFLNFATDSGWIDASLELWKRVQLQEPDGKPIRLQEKNIINFPCT